MQTHLHRSVLAGSAAVLLAALVLPATAQEKLEAENGRLRDEIAALEARVAALEAERTEHGHGGEAIERVALIADGAMRNLVAMVRDWKGGAPSEP